MNELTTTTNSGGLTTEFAAKLVKGIAESRATTTVGGGGKPLLRLLKDGGWVFGQTNDDVQEGSLWAVDPRQLAHGWVCWVRDAKNKGTLAGEIMGPMFADKPMRPTPVQGTEFTEQLAATLRCMTGADAGVEVLYKTPSHGGITAMNKLRAEIQQRLSEPGGLEYPCPVLQLSHEHYQHPSHGKTYTPLLTIVGWCSLNGEMAPEHAGVIEAPEEEPVAAPAPVRTRKPPVAATGASVPPPAPKLPPEPVNAPAPTQAAHTGQRRRPAAR